LNEHLEDLDYADYIVLLSHNFKDMPEKLNDMVDESLKVNLKINIAKTRDLRVNSTTREASKIGGEAIETVNDFTYLPWIHSRCGWRSNSGHSAKNQQGQGCFFKTEMECK
jgi:hypothetical protein